MNQKPAEMNTENIRNFCRKTIFFIVLGILSTTIPLSLSAQKIPGITTEEDLFSEEIVSEAVAPEKEGAGISEILKSGGVKIGGRFAGSANLSFTWNNPWVDGFNPSKPDSTVLTPSLSTLVYFDARPEEDFRVYGSAKVAWPFSSQNSGSSTNIPNISIFELFSDFSWKDLVYFRFGKSTVKWGTGYFFSPADVINVGGIDLFDPTAQREGPVNFRVNLSVPFTQNNLYAYAILKPQTGSSLTSLSPADLAFAGKGEIFLKPFELGFGGYYQYGRPVRGMLTLAGPLWLFDVFGEVSVASGTDKKFFKSAPAPAFVVAAGSPGAPVVSATAGFTYNDQNSNVMLIGQYLYSGEGYDPAVKDELISTLLPVLENPATPGPLLATLGALVPGIAYGSGRHYAAAALSKSELFSENLSASLTIISNLSDLSGIIRPALTWKILDNLSLGSNLTFVFGEKTAEYGILYRGNPVAVGLTLSMGTGSF